VSDRYLYNAGPISFRASGLDHAWRIVKRLDEMIAAELGDRADGHVSLGFPKADDSNFVPPADRGVRDDGR